LIPFCLIGFDLRMLAYVGTTKVSTSCCPRWRNILKSKFVGTSILQSHTVWSPQERACVVSATNSFRWSLLVNIVVDLSLLSIMFGGVLQKKNATHLWRMLYFQSIFWILTAIFTEVPSVVSHRHNFIFLGYHSCSYPSKVLGFMNVNGV
jgi:hypothetical protein